MKIVLAHNYYQFAGGEDVVFAAERDLLREHGHEVIEFTADNDTVNTMNKVSLAFNTIWSNSSYKKLTALIAQEKPDLAHFHNTFMLMSPSVYHACKRSGVPVVQTLHNYRLICPSSTFYRDGHVCEDCLGKFFPYPAVQHSCYRDSKAASGITATMLASHRLIGTWQKAITRYIVLTEFARQKFAQAGLPEDRLEIKSNFLQTDPGIGEHDGNYAVFVGRLTVEKGVLRMLEAWKSLPDIQLKIVGDGPLMEQVKQFVETHQLSNIEVMGPQPRETTLEIMKKAYCLVFPSVWYEGMPMTIIEAFATQMPVVASNIGAVSTVVTDQFTGLHFTASDAVDMGDKVRQLFSDHDLALKLGQNARKEYEEKYTPAQNYDRILEIYQNAQLAVR